MQCWTKVAAELFSLLAIGQMAQEDDDPLTTNLRNIFALANLGWMMEAFITI